MQISSCIKIWQNIPKRKVNNIYQILLKCPYTECIIFYFQRYNLREKLENTDFKIIYKEVDHGIIYYSDILKGKLKVQEIK